MRKNSFIPAILASCFLLVIMSLMYLPNGCSDPPTMPPPEKETSEMMSARTSPGVIPFESISPETGEIYLGTIYTHESDLGYEWITSIFEERLDVARHTELLMNDGFQFVLSRSKYIQTAALNDGLPTCVDITILIFEQPTPVPADVSFAILRFTTISGVSESFQLEKLFYGENPFSCWVDVPGTQIEQLDYDGLIWIQSFEPIITNPYMDEPDNSLSPMDSIPDGGPDQWSWEAFLKCVAMEAAVGCGAAGAVCMVGDDPYMECVEDGCSRAAIGAVISCGTQQIF